MPASVRLRGRTGSGYRWARRGVAAILVGMTTATSAASDAALRPTRRPRDTRTLRRGLAAAVMILPTTAIVISKAVVPTAWSDDTRALIDFVATDPVRQSAGVLLGAVAMLTLVPAFLAASRLARRRRPVMAMLAAGLNLLAYLGTGLSFGAMDNLVLAASGLPGDQRDGAAVLIDAFAASGLFNLSIGLFVIGHILGAVLLGIALRGSIPTFGWIAMAISQPAHFVCFVILQNPVLDAAAWGLTALAFVVCAVVVLQTPNDDWDLPPRQR